jgi:predicted amidohydrolase
MRQKNWVGPTLSACRDLPRNEEVWLSLGGFHERVAGNSKIANTHVIVDAQGAVVETYRKLHLFDVDVDGDTGRATARFTEIAKCSLAVRNSMTLA